jgi:Zn-dependent protease
MMVVSSFAHFGFGWGKSSPFNPANFRHPARDRMLGALAGPLCNVLQMFAWAAIYMVVIFLNPSGTHETVMTVCWYGVIINASLAAFNLLPIYPLDGHHILSYLAPREWRAFIDNPNCVYIFYALVLIPPLRDNVLRPIISPVAGALIQAALYISGWYPG